MADYTMAQAKRDFERGFLQGWELWETGSMMGQPASWTVKIESKLGMDGIGYLVDARTKNPRMFKTADSAISAIRQIGFRAQRIISGLE